MARHMAHRRGRSNATKDEAACKPAAESLDSGPKQERRTMKLIPTLMLTAALMLGAGQALAEPQFLVGTYSADGHKGMTLLKFAPATDSFTAVRTFADVENASFALYDARTAVRHRRDRSRRLGRRL
jgi:hypothetical protein